MRSPAWKNAAKSDLFDVDWRAIGTMFVLAAMTLPQPFTIVESGNFCGGTTAGAHTKTHTATHTALTQRP